MELLDVEAPQQSFRIIPLALADQLFVGNASR
jgi:hypothetical protein